MGADREEGGGIKHPVKRLVRAALQPLFNWSFDRIQGAVREMYLSTARRQAVKRFLSAIRELENAEKIVRANRFISLPRPTLLSCPAGDRILVFAPHQDDETLGAGGTLLRCLHRGKTIRIVYATDGAAGKNEVNNNSATRENEAKEIWNSLGVEDLVFWRFPTRARKFEPEAVERLQSEITNYKPDAIFLPHFFEEPHDHRLIGHLILEADRQSALPDELELWSYQITSTIVPNTVVDITELIEKKYALNISWRSQMAHFNYAHMAEGLAAYNSYYLPRMKIGTIEQISKRRPVRLYGEIFLVLTMKEYRTLRSSSISEPGRDQI
jgi:LmbE family N-acetylglucosaminyl deacetylase